MKYTLLSGIALAMLATTVSAKEFEGPCVNIIANYENAAPTKCVFYDSNTAPAIEVVPVADDPEDGPEDDPEVEGPKKPNHKHWHKDGHKGKKHRT